MATGWLTLVALQPHWSTLVARQPHCSVHWSTLGARLKAVSAACLATPHSFFWLEKMEGGFVQLICCTNCSRAHNAAHFCPAANALGWIPIDCITIWPSALGRVHYFDHPLTWARVTALRVQADQCNAFLFDKLRSIHNTASVYYRIWSKIWSDMSPKEDYLSDWEPFKITS